MHCNWFDLSRPPRFWQENDNRHYRPLHLPLASDRVSMLSRSPSFSFLTNNLRAIVAVCVQLKAVLRAVPQYVVFYYLTHPCIHR